MIFNFKDFSKNDYSVNSDSIACIKFLTGPEYREGRTAEAKIYLTCKEIIYTDKKTANSIVLEMGRRNGRMNV